MCVCTSAEPSIPSYTLMLLQCAHKSTVLEWKMLHPMQHFHNTCVHLTHSVKEILVNDYYYYHTHTNTNTVERVP